jgi:opacity protein-like surface antigen
MKAIRLLATLFVSGSMASGAAAAYPVSGKWAYDRGAPAEETCRKGPFMEFNGDRRFDSGGTVSDYRNLTVSRTGPSLYQATDLFFTGMVRGKVNYTLHLVDPDHMEMKFTMGGRLIKLRRCA